MFEQRAGTYGLTSAVARHVGVTPTSAGQWKRGMYRPEPEHWPAICDFFGYPTDHLDKAAGHYFSQASAPVTLGSEGRADPGAAVSLAQHLRLAELVDRLAAQVAELQSRLDRVDPPSGRDATGAAS